MPLHQLGVTCYDSDTGPDSFINDPTVETSSLRLTVLAADVPDVVGDVVIMAGMSTGTRFLACLVDPAEYEREFSRLRYRAAETL